MGDGLTTQTDREIADAMRDRVAQLPAIQQARSTGATPTLEQPMVLRGLPYKQLREKNVEYLGEYWRECRALYAGGPRLLKDEQLMKELFPSHSHEAPDVYRERTKRAFYFPYAGEIIDHLLAGFAADPIRLSAGIDEQTTIEKKLPAFWADFAADVSPPGGQKQPLGSFAVDCLREALITQTAWVLVDLPRRDPSQPPPSSLLEEERLGLRDPYLCLVPSENVIDWEVDDDTGELEWVLCHWRMRRRAGIEVSRNRITERWIYWTRQGWAKYEHSFDPAQPPKQDQLVPLVDEGTHPFGVVPFVRIQVPEGLYAMGKLHSLAREHLNKRCAVSWAEFKSLFAVLYEFMASGDGSPFVPQIQKDQARAVNQIRGQGYTQIRGKDDRAEFIGPDPGPFKEARESCLEIMREMHRVMFSMALSANMDSAALQRSVDSKEKDAKSIAVILTKVGEIVREGFDAVLDMVARLRRDDTAGLKTTGGEKFDADSVAAAIAEAVELLNGVPLRSPTFLQRYLFRLYKLALGPGATDEDLAAIREELETAVTAEAMMMADTSPPGPADRASPGDGEDDEDDEDDEGDEPPPRARRIFPAG